MAHISERKLKDGTTRYRAHVHRTGHKPLTKSGFMFKKDAERWASEQERSIQLAGLPLTIKELQKHTVTDIVERYLKDVTPTKGSHVNEEATLKAFLRSDIAKKSLAYIKRQDAYAYRDARLKSLWRGKPIAPSTVRREFNALSNVFVVAREQWGLENLVNPFEGITIKGSNKGRERRLKQGELERLGEACDRCVGLNRIYVRLAIYLATFTGMRLQEIFNLTWQDIDVKNRRIEIRKSKTDHLNKYAGRTIVLPALAELTLAPLAMQLMAARRYNRRARIFPMSSGAFKQSWADVRKRAKIADLHFHDLRHEAASRFDEAGLTNTEHKLMMGHAGDDMTSRYIHADLKNIQDKLDKHLFGGKTVDELRKEQNPAEHGVGSIVDMIDGKWGKPTQKLLKSLVPLLPPDERKRIVKVRAMRRVSSRSENNVIRFRKTNAR